MVATRNALRRSAKVRHGLLAAAAVMAAAQFASAATFTWVPTNAGPDSWATQANWTGGTLPTAVGDTATMNTALAAAESITLDSTVTLGTLNLGSTTAFSYTISAGTAGSFVFDNGGSGAAINQLSTSNGDTISANITLNDSLTLNNASTNTLTVSGNITDTGNGINITNSAGAGVVNISGAITSSSPNGIILSNASTKGLTVGAITDNGTQNITFGATNTAGITVSGAITDNGNGITINSSGSGNVFFNGVSVVAGKNVSSNSISGPINVLSGTLNSTAAFGASTNPFGSGTIYLGNTSGAASATLVNSSSFENVTNPIVVQAGNTGTATIEYSAGSASSLTYSGAITLNNNLTIEDASTGGGSGFVMTSPITVGTTAVTLTLTSGGPSDTAGTTLAGNLSVGSGGLTIDNANSLIGFGFSGVISGSGNITINSSSSTTVSFSGLSNTESGSIYILNGKLGGTATNNALTANPYGSTNTIYLGATTGTASTTLINNSNAEHITNPIVVQAGNSGIATIEFVNNGANTSAYSGPIALNNNLTIANAAGTGAFGLSNTATITEGPAAATLTLTGTGATTINGAVFLGAGGLTIVNAGTAAFNFTGAITSTSSESLTINNSNSGAVSFQSNSNSIGGPIYLLSGTLNNTTTLTTDPYGSTNTIYLGATTGAASTTLFNNSTNENVTNPIVVQAGNSGKATIAWSDSNVQNGNAFSGNITLDNNLTIADNNGYSITISSAVTQNVASPVILTVNGAMQVNQFLTLSGPIALTNGNLTVANGVTSSYLALSGNITGSNAITISGASTAVTKLAGIANTFSGGLTINGGTVQANNANSGVLGGGNVTFGTTTAETLDLNTFSPTIGLLAGGSSSFGVITNNSGGTGTSTLSLTGSGSQAFAGTIQNGSTAHVALVLNTGTQNLSGANSYTGGTTINGGTLQTGSSTALGFGGVIVKNATSGITTVSSGGTLDMSGQTVPEPITLNGGALVNSNLSTSAVLDNSIASVTFSNGGSGFSIGDLASSPIQIGGGGSGAAANILKLQTTASSLSASGGAGWVTGNTITVSGGGSTTSAIYTVTASSGSITGVTLTTAGVGFTTVSGLTYTGAKGSAGSFGGTGGTISLTDGTFSINSVNTTAAGTGYTSPSVTTADGTGFLATAVMSSLSLIGTANQIGGPGNLAINAVVSDGSSSGGFSKTGAGTLSLTGANGYTGGTTVSGGTLVAGSTGALGHGIVTVSGGTLEIDPAVVGTTSLMLSSPGTLKFDLGTDPTDSSIAGSGTYSLAGGTVDLGLGASDPTNPIYNTDTNLLFFSGGSIGGISITDYDTADYLASIIDNGAGTAVLSFAPASVPEPASLMLLGLGAVGLLARRRRASVA